MRQYGCPEETKSHMDNLITRYEVLTEISDEIFESYRLIEESYLKGGKLLVCGNGGSAADSDHIVGELMKSFLIKDHPSQEFLEKLAMVDSELGRELGATLQHALPAISLTGALGLSTAFANDCNPDMVFAQQVYGLGRENDVLLGISTSGNSKNVVYASIVAKAKGMHVIALTGKNDSKLSQISDVCMKAPETETFMVQELHLPIYHCLCSMLESSFFADGRHFEPNM